MEYCGGFESAKLVWSSAGVVEAVKEMMKTTNTLFDDMKKKLMDYPELRNMLYAILFNGIAFPYNPDSFVIDIGVMFGFLKEKDGQACVANRIFETRMYNYFMYDLLSFNFNKLKVTGIREMQCFGKTILEVVV